MHIIGSVDFEPVRDGNLPHSFDLLAQLDLAEGRIAQSSSFNAVNFRPGASGSITQTTPALSATTLCGQIQCLKDSVFAESFQVHHLALGYGLSVLLRPTSAMGYDGFQSQRGKHAKTFPSGAAATPTICGSLNSAITCSGELVGAVEVTVESAAAGAVTEPELLAGDKRLPSSKPVAASSAVLPAAEKREKCMAFGKDNAKKYPTRRGGGIFCR